MDISIYIEYIVQHECKYSYRTGYDEFKEDKFKVKREMQGGELMFLVADLLKKENSDQIRCSRGIIEISEFNPFSGETAYHKIKYKEKHSVFDRKVPNESRNS